MLRAKCRREGRTFRRWCAAWWHEAANRPHSLECRRQRADWRRDETSMRPRRCWQHLGGRSCKTHMRPGVCLGHLIQRPRCRRSWTKGRRPWPVWPKLRILWSPSRRQSTACCFCRPLLDFQNFSVVWIPARRQGAACCLQRPLSVSIDFGIFFWFPAGRQCTACGFHRPVITG